MKKYKVSMYLRVSREDINKNESESILNQRAMLKDYVDKNEDLQLVSIRIDDGYSGSDFERPAFKDMMEDVKNRKIDCIIVKDFSRFGRDFIEVGRYLEEIFPFMGVRFISINDNYDSLKGEKGIDSLIIPFKNLINDSYLRDISLKIRSSLDIKRKKGEFIGSFATYGYLKDENNKNKLVVDKVACKVVEDIFKYRLEGLSADKIAKKLNKEGVLSPMEYKKSIGINISTNFKKNEKALWSAKAIFRILENPIYIGTLEQNKTTTPNYKIKKSIVVPKEDRIVVYNSHKPIISKEVFENVQKLMAIDTRTSPNQEKVYLLSGFINCAECGSNLIRKNNGTKQKPYFYYICNNAKNKNGCIGSSVKIELIEYIVFNIVKEHINISVNFDNILNLIDNNIYTLKEVDKAKNLIYEKKKEIEKYKNIKSRLGEDLKEGIIIKEEYKYFSRLYNNKIIEAKDIITDFEKELKSLSNKTNKKQIWLEYLKKNKNIESLNRKLIISLIDEIKIHKDKIIEICFKYKDEYKRKEL